MITPRKGTVLISALLAGACGPRGNREVSPADTTAEMQVRDTVKIVAQPDSQALQQVTVPALLGSNQWNGMTVRVSGQCLGYRVPPVAVGGPPRTRSDWQLAADGAAIYVTGPLPQGCSATEGSTGLIGIVATVREDSLPSLGGQPSRSRRYLEWNGTVIPPAR
jgi:hypothetical protein